MDTPLVEELSDLVGDELPPLVGDYTTASIPAGGRLEEVADGCSGGVLAMKEVDLGPSGVAVNEGDEVPMATERGGGYWATEVDVDGLQGPVRSRGRSGSNR